MRRRVAEQHKVGFGIGRHYCATMGCIRIAITDTRASVRPSAVSSVLARWQAVSFGVDKREYSALGHVDRHVAAENKGILGHCVPFPGSVLA
jgi:hypothetical protein